MAINNIWEYDAATAGNNTEFGSVSVAEGMAPSGVNNAMREFAMQARRLCNQGSDIASAATCNIAATGTSFYAKVTGTTGITSFGTANAGVWRFITFTGALLLTHNATSLKLPGAANITTAADDAGLFVSEGSGNWRCMSFSKASGASVVTPTIAIAAAVTPDTGAVVAATAVKTFRMPFAFTVTEVRGSLATAQTGGSLFTVDINESGSTILSTKITIDNGEKTSETAAAPPVVSDAALADDAEITIDVDQIGDGTAKGLTVYLIGRQA